MDPLPWFWALATAGVFALCILILREAFRLGRRLRVNTIWGAAAGLLGLDFSPMTRKLGPALRGSYQSREAAVTVGAAKRPRSGRLTRATLRLRARSPLRVRVRRESSMSLLGQLARVGFRPDRLDESDVFQVEGDKELFKDIVRGELRALLSSEEDWAFALAEEEVALEKPVILASVEGLQDALQLLSRVADRVEARAGSAGADAPAS